MIDRLRREVGAHLQAQRWTARERDAPEVPRPVDADELATFARAAWLLSSDGASTALDDLAWWAAYDYYGHDVAGIEYADEMLARAIGWSQHGFCMNCGVGPRW